MTNDQRRSSSREMGGSQRGQQSGQSGQSGQSEQGGQQSSHQAGNRITGKGDDV